MLRVAVALAALLTAPAAADSALDDASQLFQASSQVRGAAQDPQAPKGFAETLQDVKGQWKMHRERQMAELEPWKLKELRKSKAAHKGSRPKPQAPSKARPLTAEESAALEKEAMVAKFGDAMQLVARDSMGREIDIKFRSQARLQVLMHSVCKKWGLDAATTNFTFKERRLEPSQTPATFGLVDQDVIEVNSPIFATQKAEQERRAKKAAQITEVRQLEVAKEQKKAEAVSTRKRKVAKKNEAIAAQQKRKHQLQVNGMITLRFKHPTGGKDVTIAVKKNNWLEGTMSLVAKRMGFDPAKTRFFYGGLDRKAIGPHDSVSTLRLKDEEEITMKVPAIPVLPAKK